MALVAAVNRFSCVAQQGLQQKQQQQRTQRTPILKTLQPQVSSRTELRASFALPVTGTLLAPPEVVHCMQSQENDKASDHDRR